MYRGFNISVRGSSHVKEGAKCQDSSVYFIVENERWALSAVANGHGGANCFRSDIGSKFAVESAVAVAHDYLADMDIFVDALGYTPEKVFRGMEASILSKWNTAVQEYDAANFELSEWEQEWCKKKGVVLSEYDRVDLYGSTFVMTLMSPDFVLAIQNGDGACVAIYNDGSRKFFLPQDKSDNPANMKHSIGSFHAMEYFKHHYVLRNPPCLANEEKFPEYYSESPLEKALRSVESTHANSDTAPSENEPEIQTEQINTAPQWVEVVEVPDELIEDEDEEDEETCSKDILEFRVFIPKRDIPVCMMTSTDGLINSCANSRDFLKFNRRILSMMDETNIHEKLQAHLSDKRSSMGSNDDISIAMTFDKNLNLADFQV